KPFAAMLAKLAERGIGHGAINPTRLFHGGGGAIGYVLGECVTCPSGYLQSVVFETIPRGMCQPIGKGPAVLSDDMYAFGVTLLALLLGRDPGKGRSAEELIETKIDKGSYSVLVRAGRVPNSMIEPLRGLINDDPAQRWTIDDLTQWIGGRRLTPKQSGAVMRAPRAFKFGGKEYWNSRSLAIAVAGNPRETVRVIQSEDLQRWVQRSLSSKAMIENLSDAVSAIGKGGADYEDRTICRISMVLDPEAPMRYRDLRIMPQAIGMALSDAFNHERDVQVFAAMLMQQMPVFWLGAQSNSRSQTLSGVRQFDQFRGFLTRSYPGYGIERCLYEANLFQPCSSTMLRRFLVLSVTDLLKALETVSADKDRPRDPLDRHVAAFIVTRDRCVEDSLLRLLDINSAPVDKCLARLNILASLQSRCDAGPLPGLSVWVAGLMDPAIERFHRRKLREQMRKKLNDSARSGDLRSINQIVDDMSIVREDERSFRKAKKEFAAIAFEMRHLRRDLDRRDTLGHDTGRHFALIMSIGIAFVAMVGIVLKLVVVG
ncbi:MAG: serine/threonine protein kinase, partial [Pseudomonadota bacterium]|nr:serine/threonine protein kinase [Pseudomonadota bacterium]